MFAKCSQKRAGKYLLALSIVFAVLLGPVRTKKLFLQYYPGIFLELQAKNLVR